MGEIADMMLDGTLCETCGTLIGDPCGYPRYCSKDCADAHGVTLDDDVSDRGSRTCPLCKKTLKSAMGMRQHMRDKHGED